MLDYHLSLCFSCAYNLNERSNNMAASPSSSGTVSPRRPALAGLPANETRFDQRLSTILEHATEVFYEKGYEGASIRDLSRATGMSLAGLYYYFESKEELLYLIQKHTFSTIMAKLSARIDGIADPEQRIRLLILNHLEYFLANDKAMKVLSREDSSLRNGFGDEVAALKREYYKIARGLLDDFKSRRKLEFSSRIALLSLFGMMNWIYTWYNPRMDADAAQLALQMGDLFLRGIGAAPTLKKARKRHRSASRRASIG
jgi:TetR/AcrR family transcriptional regulator, cholesterol catabolism regulator